MTYYVVGPDGNRYGPADVATLNQWAMEGRLTQETWVEEVQTGQRVLATVVPGIRLGPPPQPDPTDVYGRFRPHGFSIPDNGSKDVTYAFVWGAAGLLCCAIFAVIGIVFALKAKEKG